MICSCFGVFWVLFIFWSKGGAKIFGRVTKEGGQKILTRH